MSDISDLKIGIYVEFNSEPYEVIASEHVKIGRGGAIKQTRLKNLITGSVISKNFKGNDKFTEPEITQGKAQFLYPEGESFYFMNEENYEQFPLLKKQLGNKEKFLKEGAQVNVLYFNGQPISLTMPTKIAFEVIDAPPDLRGNTAQGGSKQVIIETGATINAPLFIKKGDRIKINTETGEYVERV